MALGQMIVLVLEAVCVAIDNTSSNIAAVFFVFLYETCFTWGASPDSGCNVQSLSHAQLDRMDGYCMGLPCRNLAAQDPGEGCRTRHRI